MLLNRKEKILDIKSGDVTGNGVDDEVYITACLNETCKYRSYLTLKEKISGKVHNIGIDEEYYKFEIMLESFKDPCKKDIFLRCIGDGYGGHVRGKIFSYEDGRLAEIFDSEVFCEKNKLSAFYKNDYEIEVRNSERNKKYFISIRENYKYYLDFVYDKNGKVKHGKEKVNIGRVFECYPFYKFGSEVSSLSISQKILGQADTDYIADVESIVKWEEEDFMIINQTVNIKGNLINQNYRGSDICVNEGCFKIIKGREEVNEEVNNIIKKEFNIDDHDFRYIRYDIDLNNDGEDEVFIYLKDWYFCTVKGCKALVLKKDNNSYKVIGSFENLIYPIIVSNTETNGYKELILYISGMGIENGYRKAKFDNGKYTGNIFLENVISLNDLQIENVKGYLLGEYYQEGDGKFVIDTKIKRKDLAEIVKNFINKGSEILFTSETDVDKDGNREIIAAYRYAKGLYLVIIEESDGQWGLIDVIKGKGYNVNKIIIAPLEDGKYHLIVVWEMSDIWSTLDVYSKDKYGLYNYLEISKPFNNLEVEDIDGNGLFEIIIWNRDSGDAYKIDIYRVQNNNLIKARELYEKYFKDIVKYYKGLVNKNPSSPIYWYYLSESQFIAGYLEDALKSINMDLSFQYPYYSKEDALLFKEKIEGKLKKQK